MIQQGHRKQSPGTRSDGTHVGDIYLVLQELHVGSVPNLTRREGERVVLPTTGMRSGGDRTCFVLNPASCFPSISSASAMGYSSVTLAYKQGRRGFSETGVGPENLESLTPR